ncbi:uncharacterized protein LOC135805812 [Sycon ciliatum]|uniref:uncharacterized protein LOC135805812 n=1 Tax=Sycon ciliatum TaxID=27933 RepID=UPI0020A982A3|eukprot:scpid44984/ scgid31648/ 
MCDDYDTYCDDSLSVTWIVVIVVCVIIKILFWSFVCYRWRRRTYYRTHSVVVVQPTHTVTHPGQAAVVRGVPVTAHPHYPSTPASVGVGASAPPAYGSEPKKYPSAPSSEPPAYSDTAPLLP